MATLRPQPNDVVQIQAMPGCAGWTYDGSGPAGAPSYWKPCFGAYLVWIFMAGNVNRPDGPFEGYTAAMTMGGAAGVAVRALISAAHAAAAGCIGNAFPAGYPDVMMVLDNWATNPQIDHPAFGLTQLFAPPRHPNLAGFPMTPGWWANHADSINLMRRLTPLSQATDPKAPNYSPLLWRLCHGWDLLLQDSEQMLQDAAALARPGASSYVRGGRFPQHQEFNGLPHAGFDPECVHLGIGVACAVDGPWLAYKLAWGMQRCMGHRGDNHNHCRKVLVCRRRLTDPGGLPWPGGPRSDPRLGMASRKDHMFNHTMPNPDLVRWYGGPAGMPAYPPIQFAAWRWPQHGGTGAHCPDNMCCKQCPMHANKGAGLFNGTG